MQFDSLGAFVQMGGYGLYIWAAYGITLVVLGFNLWWPQVTRARFVKLERQSIERAGLQQVSAEMHE